MTVAEALASARARLREAGIATPDLDGELLLRHVLGLDRAQLVASPGRRLSDAESAAFEGLVSGRASRRPLQHLTGRQWFWRHELLVTPDVLVPRPETEVLVEAALRRLAGRPSPVVADVGTGSGCIALALAAERPDAEVHATDLSPAALAVARENARRLGLTGRVRFHEGDLLTPLAAARVAPLDLVASNPPYVDRAEEASLMPEVRHHEPALALFPPGDRWSIYRRLVPAAAACLAPGGALLLEVGAGMAPEVAALAREAGFVVDALRPDLQGIERVVEATRPA
jgi:release factor glutamine methyltransferase